MVLNTVAMVKLFDVLEDLSNVVTTITVDLLNAYLWRAFVGDAIYVCIYRYVSVFLSPYCLHFCKIFETSTLSLFNSKCL